LRSQTKSPATTNAAEARVRQAMPIARIIYLQPDIHGTTSPGRAAAAPIADPQQRLEQFCRAPECAVAEPHGRSITQAAAPRRSPAAPES